MKTLLFISILYTALLAQEYQGGNIKSVTVTDTSVFIVTIHDGTMYNRDVSYVGDYYLIKKGKLTKKNTDTAEVTPAVVIKEKIVWKKDKKIAP